MAEKPSLIAELVAEAPPMIAVEFPDIDVHGMALAHEDGYIVAAVHAGRASCAILGDEVVRDTVAFRAALSAGIGEDGPLNQVVGLVTAVSGFDPLLFIAIEEMDALRERGAPPSEIRDAEARAVAIHRADGDTSPGMLTDDAALGALGDSVMDEGTATLLGGEAPAIVSAIDGLVGRLSFQAINALAPSFAYGAAAYNFYAEPGEVGRLRRSAAYRLSGLGGTIGGDPLARAGLDAGEPLGAIAAGVLTRRLGRDFPRDVAARMVDAEFEPAAYAERIALFALSEIPAAWFPASRNAQRAFCSLAWGLRSLWSPDRPGSFRALTEGCQGNWSGFAIEVALPQPGDPVTADAIQDAIEARVGLVARMSDLFCFIAGIPAAMLAGFCTLGDEEGRDRVRHASLGLFGEGRELFETLVAVSEWTETRGAVHLAAVAGATGEDLRWPALHDPVSLPNGMTVVSLCSSRAIHAEGASGPDADGLAGLDNDASSRLCLCALGQFYLSSVRSADGARLATFQMHGEDGALVIDAISGPGASEADPAVVEAIEWVHERLGDGRIPNGSKAIADWVEELGPEGAHMADCGYDWRVEANVRRAVDAFRPFMVPGVADLPYEALVDALRARSTAPVPVRPPSPPPAAPARSWRDAVADARMRLGLWIMG